jgi:hypothetical protein
VKFMQKLTISTVLLSQMFCVVFAADVTINKVTALRAPAWLQQGGGKTELNSNQELKAGDQITTGKSGQVEIQIGSAASLQLYSDSKMSILAEETGKSSTQAHPVMLAIHQGKSCIHSDHTVKPDDILNINVASSVVSAVSSNYDFCVQREGSLSSVKLRNGSIQVNHSREGLFILSEPGIKLQIDENGSFDLIASDSEGSAKATVDKQMRNETEKVSQTQPATTLKSETSPTQDKQPAIETNTAPTSKKMSKQYNVYLFSTLDKAQAEKVNQRFHQGNLDSVIIIVDQKGTSRYRIVVPGFKSLEEAQAFSKSVKGKLGISSTWIGRGKAFEK